MVPVADMIPPDDAAQVRHALRSSLARLMEAQDYLAGHIAVLDGIERQVRSLALREGTLARGDAASPEALGHLGALQAETNANFRAMHETYAALSAQIAALMKQHEGLYDATFAR